MPSLNNLKLNSSSVLVFSLITCLMVAFFIFVSPTLEMLVSLMVMAVICFLLLTDTELALLALIVIRPAIDILGSNTIKLGQFSFNLSSAISLLVIVWAVVILIKQRSKVWLSPLFLPIALFLLVSTASLFYSAYPEQTWREYFRLASIFLLYFMAYQLFAAPEKIQRLGRALLISFILPIAFGLVQLFTQTGLTFGEFSNRVYGTFGHPNVFAFYLVLGLAVFLSYWLSQTAESRPKPLIFIILLFGLLLGLTLTRGAWLGLIVFLLVLGLARYRKALLITLAAIIILVSLGPTLNRLSFEYLNFDFRRISLINRLVDWQSEDSSFDWRLEVWSEMKSKFYQKPVLGWGLGSFPKIREQQIESFFEGTEAHNDYFRLAIETGVIGLAAYLWLLIALITKLILQHRQALERSEKNIQLGAISLVFAIVAMSFFDNLLQATAVMWAFWILMAGKLRTTVSSG